MANEEQVALLKQGNEVWNEWRKQNPEIEIDLSFADLRGTDFRGGDTSSFIYFNLTSANFRFANLSKSHLTTSDLSNADLSESDLSEANFNYSDFISANLSNTNLSNTNLRKTNLSNANLNNANLNNADLSEANLSFSDFRSANLSNANLSNANLSNADISNADISNADLSNANLEHADLRHADLNSATLRYNNLIGTNLSEATLKWTNLSFADLSLANLSNADLSNANLGNANLSNATLAYAVLRNANLGYANLSNAILINSDISDAILIRSQVIHTNFTQAVLTGACIADWHIGSSTNLQDVKCDYVFHTYDDKKEQFSGRLPIDHESTFAPGEFTQLFQVIATALQTIPITFTKGINWQAFFQAFQDLRTSRPGEDISIQGMESKGDAFVVRLEVDAEANKAAIETEVKQRYAHQLAALEAQYQERLRLQSNEIATYRQTQSSLLHIVQTMAEKDSISQTFHGPVGNVAGTNQGQMTAYINQNNETISQLIAALRASAQTFPPEQKDDVLMELDDLEGDLSKPEKQEPKRIGKRLQRLLAAGTTAATLVGGAATFSGNVNDFTANVLELGEKIGLSRDAIQSNP